VHAGDSGSSKINWDAVRFLVFYRGEEPRTAGRFLDCSAHRFRSSAPIFSRIAHGISGMPHRQRKNATTKKSRKINGNILIKAIA
jgi:hypothetical protein